MTPRVLAGVLLLVVVAVGSGFTAYQWWMVPGDRSAPAETRPDLTFTGLDGGSHALSQWDGKLVLVNFWATWCTPCLKEIPLLVAAQAEFGPRGFQVVGIAMDDAAPVRRFAERTSINYPLMIGKEDVISAMDALGDRLGAFPFSVLIDQQGRIRERISGDLSEPELAALLDRYLGT